RDWTNRVPGAGGASGGPARHWAMLIQLLATSPCTCKAGAASLRVCAPTWRDSTAVLPVRLGSAPPPCHSAPEAECSCADGRPPGTSSPRLVNDQAKVFTPITAML